MIDEHVPHAAHNSLLRILDDLGEYFDWTLQRSARGSDKAEVASDSNMHAWYSE